MAKRKTIGLSEPIIKKMLKANTALSISQTGIANDAFIRDHKTYIVVSGLLHRGKVKYVNAYEIQLLEHYSGELEPLTYSRHWQEADWGNRKRSYKGMRIQYRQHSYVVITDEIRFVPVKVPSQTSLF